MVNHNPTGRSSSLVIIVLLVAAAVGGLLWFMRQSRIRSHDAEQLALARDAIAATENLEANKADEDWNRLFQAMPDDPSVAINRALNRVLHVDALTESTNNALLSAEEKKQVRMQLPQAIADARQAIEDFQRIGQDGLMTFWLQTRVDLQEASLLPAVVGKSMRREIFERLQQAVPKYSADPRAVMLGGSLSRVLEESESPTSGLPADMLQPAAQALNALSDAEPTNLFIALRASTLNIEAKSSAAKGLIQRTLDLSAAIEPSLRAQTQSVGLTPASLVQQIDAAIEMNDWQKARNQMMLWFNVLNATDLVKTDRRLATPHPLDRLSFDALRRLSAKVAADEPIQSTRQPISFVQNNIDAKHVNGANGFSSIIDVDLDLDPDVLSFVVTGDTTQATIWRNDLPQGWTQLATTKIDMPVRGAIAADLFMVDASDAQRLQVHTTATGEGAEPVHAARHNTLQTLVLFGEQGAKLYVADGRPDAPEADRLKPVDKDAGLDDVTAVTAAVTGDWEGDGDLDLAFATADKGLRMFINRGNRTFFEAGPTEGNQVLAELKDIQTFAIADLDRDLDLDLLTLRPSGQVGLVENLLHLQFRYRDLPEVIAPKATQLFVADLDGNVSWDLVLGGGEQAQVVYSQTADAGAWTVDKIERLPGTAGRIALFDSDNDSWDELFVAAGDTVQVKRIVSDQLIDLDNLSLSLGSQATAVSDFNRDGLLDLLSWTDQGPTLCLNQTANKSHYVDIRFRGIDDNNANSGRVNHYAIGSVLELRFGPHYRASIITQPLTHFGMDGLAQADSLRVIFPNGLTQTVRQPAADTLVEEEQTLKGSCPYLYAWDGDKFAFVTDCLWAAPLGLQVAAGVVAKDRPWEYLKVDGKYLQAVDNGYDLRLTEELWEVAYVDHISLQAVDHPADCDIWTNEKVGPPDLAEPRIYTFSQSAARPLVTAQDTVGRDMTQRLQAIDGQYVQGFDRRLRQGLCPPHWIDLNFGTASDWSKQSQKAYLVLTGWILPTDTSLNIQIDQNPELPAIEFPSVWVPERPQSDQWKQVIPFMGFPGGKTKTIVVDVTEFAQADDLRFRVRTSAQIYWDAASLVLDDARVQPLVHDLHLMNATLDYHGFSQKRRESVDAPEIYSFDDVSREPKWPPLNGKFTTYGDAYRLLDKWDDRMVVMGSGDELKLRFSVPDKPVPVGWKRDFVLHCVGWDKDADLNTLVGQSSEPLPFKQMQSYPPTLVDQSRWESVDRLNDEHLQRRQSFRKFWSRP